MSEEKYHFRAQIFIHFHQNLEQKIQFQNDIFQIHYDLGDN